MLWAHTCRLFWISSALEFPPVWWTWDQKPRNCLTPLCPYHSHTKSWHLSTQEIIRNCLTSLILLPYQYDQSQPSRLSSWFSLSSHEFCHIPKISRKLLTNHLWYRYSTLCLEEVPLLGKVSCRTVWTNRPRTRYHRPQSLMSQACYGDMDTV